MEYIIKESQFSIIVESTRIGLFQELIDSNLALIRKECEEGVEYVGILSEEACEQLEKLEKIEVTSADWVKVKHSNRPKEENYMNVRIMVKLLESFLSDYSIEGVCGFWVDDELDVLSNYFVVVILDIDWIQKIQTKPEFVAKRFRDRIKEEIKKYLGMDVTIGSVAKKCVESESLTESKKDYIVTESQLKLLIKVNNTSSCSMS